jgi:histone H3/H4
MFNMPRKRSLIPAAPMAEILKRAGAERVSEDAARAFAELLMDNAAEVARDAVKFSHHAGRKTVKRQDILLAKKST